MRMATGIMKRLAAVATVMEAAAAVARTAVTLPPQRKATHHLLLRTRRPLELRKLNVGIPSCPSR